MAGITPRTLHYYDEIGILKPSSVGENGYRYYAEEELLRLQQILLYREMEMPLAQIGRIMGDPDYDVLSALAAHKEVLERRIERTRRLIATIESTIRHLRGEEQLDETRIFDGFTEEEEQAYAAEAERMYDPTTVRSANRKWKNYGPEKRRKILAEGNRIYTDLREAMPAGAGSPQAQECIQRWRVHMDYFWTPSLEQLLGLAEMYNSDERFRSRFDALDPGLVAFMREAVGIYVASQRQG